MPPERGNSAASSAYVSAPHSVTAPPSTQLRRNSGTSSTRCAIAAGVRKMPLPIVEPTTTATALHRPRRRGSRSPQRSSGVGVDMRPHNIHFQPHDATLRAARMGRRRLHLPPHRPRRHRADHGVRDGLRRPLAAVQRAPAPPTRRSRNPDRVEPPAGRRPRLDPRGALGGSAWWLRRDARSATPDVSNGPIGHRPRPLATARDRPGVGAYVALALLLVQVGLGAVTVKLALPPWTVILHLGTAMLLLAALIVAARGVRLTPGSRPGLVALALGFATVLFGALTTNLGAASACLGFPLCNGQLAPDGNSLQHVHWTHRLLAYTLFAYTLWWAARTGGRRAWGVVALVVLQIAVGAVMVLLVLPPPVQAAHVAVGAAVWAALVLAVA